MTASFVAYIDESGDEGFKFRESVGKQGSSDWFVLAAFITRKKTDLEVVKLIDRVRAEFNLSPTKHIHWMRLKHSHKVRYVQLMAALQARIIGVCFHKPMLSEPETFQERYRLYFYAVRCLLERVSWLARDRHDATKWGGDGTVDVCFAHRSGMPYEDMRQYLRLLQKQKMAGQNIQIDFKTVLPEAICTLPSGRSMGLQLADAAAGAFFNGLERNPFGNTEPQYLKTLSPLLYKYKNQVYGYGFKVLPKEADAVIRNEPSFRWAR